MGGEEPTLETGRVGVEKQIQPFSGGEATMAMLPLNPLFTPSSQDSRRFRVEELDRILKGLGGHQRVLGGNTGSGFRGRTPTPTLTEYRSERSRDGHSS